MVMAYCTDDSVIQITDTVANEAKPHWAEL